MAKKQKQQKIFKQPPRRVQTDQNYFAGDNDLIYKPAYGFFLPPDCPVMLIGVDEHWQIYYYINGDGALVELSRKNHNLPEIKSLFGNNLHWLMSRYCKVVKVKDESGGEQFVYKPHDINLQKIVDHLHAETQYVVEINKITRKSGCWHSDGNLIVHHGDSITEYGGLTASPPLKHPLGMLNDIWYIRDKRGCELLTSINEDLARQSARDLCDIIGSWNWRRSSLDPHLFFGCIIAAFFGGALKWRSSVWVEGIKGTGKSTLLQFIDAFMLGGSFKAGKVSEAGIRNNISSTTLPVILDEQKTEFEKIQPVLDLMRYGSSGDDLVIATVDKRSQIFPIRSAFIFCSIGLPSLDDQDVSRLTIFRLSPLEQGIKMPFISDEIEELARNILSFIALRWYDMSARLALVEDYLITKRIEAREIDQLSAPLAFASYLLESGDISYEMLDGLFPDVAYSHIANYNEEEWDSCLTKLLSSQIEVMVYNDPNSERHDKLRLPVGNVIQQALKDGSLVAGGRLDEEYAVALERVGLKLVVAGGIDYLFVSTSHAALELIFRGSIWGIQHGRTKGTWCRVLGEVRNSITDNAARQYIDGQRKNGVLLPLSEIIVKQVR